LAAVSTTERRTVQEQDRSAGVRAAQAIRDAVTTTEALLDPTLVAGVVEAAAIVSAALRGGGKLLAFGNGGSAADASHIVGELLGRFLHERPAAAAVALADTAATLTAVANDYGFERVFARQVEGLGREGDVALAISTSGASANVLAGVHAARLRGLRTIGLTGGSGGALRGAVEVCLLAPSADTPRIQEAHMVLGHVLCDLVEQDLLR
jgi:D-sedoheptulose 7-phosphate isomerase